MFAGEQLKRPRFTDFRQETSSARSLIATLVMLTSFLRALLLFVVFSASAYAQAPKHEIKSEYDKFKDISVTMLLPMLVEDPNTRSMVYVLAFWECPGRVSCKPEAVYLGFGIVSGAEPYRGPGIARMIRDGVRQEPHKLTYLGVMEPKGLALPFTTQGFRATISPEGLVKLANSSTVEFQIDTFEFAFTPENLAALRDLVSRMK